MEEKDEGVYVAATGQIRGKDGRNLDVAGVQELDLKTSCVDEPKSAAAGLWSVRSGGFVIANR